eukprot:Blabericola_migrator_1__11118@NODE_649_length_7061_cov_165_821132_g475_i0_p7_GENE_NODE_649_length_7061_cov_165_821132_g475_i0NODE_649_length_7061_cov_165_821132_g475_i0_p7_ORF_typecomplete_len111_score13_27_NODE_649_length_7061_cov_165_821132_g475_i064826814
MVPRSRKRRVRLSRPQSKIRLIYLYYLGKSGVCSELRTAATTEDEVDPVAVAKKEKDFFDVLRAIYSTGKRCEVHGNPLSQDLGSIRVTPRQSVEILCLESRITSKELNV